MNDNPGKITLLDIVMFAVVLSLVWLADESFPRLGEKQRVEAVVPAPVEEPAP